MYERNAGAGMREKIVGRKHVRNPGERGRRGREG